MREWREWIGWLLCTAGFHDYVAVWERLARCYRKHPAMRVCLSERYIGGRRS